MILFFTIFGYLTNQDVAELRGRQEWCLLILIRLLKHVPDYPLFSPVKPFVRLSDK